MKRTLAILAALGALLALAFFVLPSLEREPHISKRTYDRLRLGMTVEEVDAIIVVSPGDDGFEKVVSAEGEHHSEGIHLDDLKRHGQLWFQSTRSTWSAWFAPDASGPPEFTGKWWMDNHTEITLLFDRDQRLIGRKCRTYNCSDPWWKKVIARFTVK